MQPITATLINGLFGEYHTVLSWCIRVHFCWCTGVSRKLNRWSWKKATIGWKNFIMASWSENRTSYKHSRSRESFKHNPVMVHETEAASSIPWRVWATGDLLGHLLPAELNVDSPGYTNELPPGETTGAARWRPTHFWSWHHLLKSKFSSIIQIWCLVSMTWWWLWSSQHWTISSTLTSRRPWGTEFYHSTRWTNMSIVEHYS